MKKLLSILLATLLVVTGCSSSNSGTKTFTGKGVGYSGGEITAEVTVSEDAITEVVLSGEGQTEGIGGAVLETFGAKIVDAQSLEIDTVAGATLTSEGVLEAVKNALDGNFDLSKLGGSGSGDAGTIEKTADVVIVGAGGAGMTAAIEASDAGKSVIIMEIAGITGGNSTRATGGMNAGKTTVQDTNEFAEDAGIKKVLESAKKYPELADLAKTVSDQYDAYKASPEGYFDSKELFMLDTLVGGTNLNNPTLVETLVSNTPSGIEWLLGKGIDLNLVGSFGGASVKRIHKPTVDGKSVAVGSFMVPKLEQIAKDNGVEFLMETEATNIVKEGEGIKGVQGVDSKGNDVIVSAKAVIIASGGFGANSEMVVGYRPDLAGFVTTNASTIQGDGIRMVQEIGGDVVDVDQIQIHPTVEQNTSALITEGLRGDGAILVNKEGLRFTDEVGTRDKVSADIIAQTDSTSYLIIDQKMVDESAVIAGYIKKGFTVEGETVADLATAMGVDAANLESTIETWNKAVDAKSDAEFNRTSFAEKLDTAKFYAIQVAPGVHHTMGGVRINEKAEVLDAQGNPISGLFAAGEVTGGVHGSNRLGGNAVADFVVFGRIAGQSAAALK